MLLGERLARNKPRIAIIGSGAAAERVHLPALSKIGLKPVLLVDRNLARAKVLADQYLAEITVYGSVELPHINLRIRRRASICAQAVIDGGPERRPPAKGQVTHVLAEVEADGVGQKAHLDA